MSWLARSNDTYSPRHHITAYFQFHQIKAKTDSNAAKQAVDRWSFDHCICLSNITRFNINISHTHARNADRQLAQRSNGWKKYRTITFWMGLAFNPLWCQLKIPALCMHHFIVLFVCSFFRLNTRTPFGAAIPFAHIHTHRHVGAHTYAHAQRERESTEAHTRISSSRWTDCPTICASSQCKPFSMYNLPL